MSRDWRIKHGEVIKDFLNYLNQRSGNYILKGGTSLMMCYGLDRFSEDIDLDGTDKQKIKNIVADFCKDYGYTYRIAKDTDTVKRFMINYDSNTERPKPLKVEISYRTRNINRENVTIKNGIAVYNINSIARMKSSAYTGRDKIRDLFDISFICNKYFDELSETIKDVLRDSLGQKGIEQYDMVVNEQSDELIDNDLLAESFLNAWEKLGLSESIDNSPTLSEITENERVKNKENETEYEYGD